MLVFPRRTLLCPANSQLKTVIDLPLFTKVGVGTARDIREITEIKSPLTSRALYGPVVAGVLCTSIKSNVGVSIRDLRGDDEPSTLAARSSGDDPEISAVRGRGHRLTEQDLTAYVNVTVSNQTEKPLEVAKIMIPTDLLALFDSDGVIRTGRVQMHLLSETEEELDFKGCPDTEANPITDLHGRERVSDGRKHIFDLTYRNKTGLEYGF